MFLNYLNIIKNTMKTLIIKKYRNNIYSVDQNTTSDFFIFGRFLTRSVYWFTDITKKYLEEDQEFNSNAYFAEKKGNRVFIYDHYDDNAEFSIPYDKLIQLLDVWKKVYVDLPEKVIITFDEDF